MIFKVRRRWLLQEISDLIALRYNLMLHSSIILKQTDYNKGLVALRNISYQIMMIMMLLACKESVQNIYQEAIQLDGT